MKIQGTEENVKQALPSAAPTHCTLKRFGKLCLNMLEQSVKSWLLSLQNWTNSKASDGLWKS